MKFGKVDVGRYPELAKKYYIDDSSFSRQLPTVIVFKNGEECMRRPAIDSKGKLQKFIFSEVFTDFFLVRILKALIFCNFDFFRITSRFKWILITCTTNARTTRSKKRKKSASNQNRLQSLVSSSGSFAFSHNLSADFFSFHTK